MQFKERFVFIFGILFITLIITVSKFCHKKGSYKDEKSRLLREALNKRIASLSTKMDTLKPIQNTNVQLRRDISQDVVGVLIKDCSNLTLIIMVTSSAKNFQARQAIRQTYLNWKRWRRYLDSRSVKMGALFLVGKTAGNVDYESELRREAELHRDILLIDLTESFYSLSYKLMVGFQWVDEHCHYQHLLKIDDDVAVNMHSLVEFLRHFNDTRQQLYIGNYFPSEGAVVYRHGRYGISRQEWPAAYYSSYVSGGCFLVSKVTVRHIIPHFNWRMPLKIDDAYIGHLVRRAGGDIWSSRLFNMSSSACVYNSSLIALHPNQKADRIPCKQLYNKNSLRIARSSLL